MRQAFDSAKAMQPNSPEYVWPENGNAISNRASNEIPKITKKFPGC